MSEMEAILTTSLDKLFREIGSGAVADMEAGQWSDDLWREIENSGFTRALHSDMGLSWSEAGHIFRATGFHRVPAPVGETILGVWLLEQAGIEICDGPLTVASAPVGDGEMQVQLKRVPWARNAEHLVVVSESDPATVMLFDRAHFDCEHGENLAGEPRDAVRLNLTSAKSKGRLVPGAVSVIEAGAMMRSAQIAGALDWVLATSVPYAGEREQFGRAIAKFQAVQQQLAQLAAGSLMVTSAVEHALSCLSEGHVGNSVAVAKICAGDTAGDCVRIAHAVHGAMGFTREYPLHEASRRIWSWRSEYGSGRSWANALGKVVCASGAEGFWPSVTAPASEFRLERL